MICILYIWRTRVEIIAADLWKVGTEDIILTMLIKEIEMLTLIIRACIFPLINILSSVDVSQDTTEWSDCFAQHVFHTNLRSTKYEQLFVLPIPIVSLPFRVEMPAFVTSKFQFKLNPLGWITLLPDYSSAFCHRICQIQPDTPRPKISPNQSGYFDSTVEQSYTNFSTYEWRIIMKLVVETSDTGITSCLIANQVLSHLKLSAFLSAMQCCSTYWIWRRPFIQSKFYSQHSVVCKSD